MREGTSDISGWSSSPGTLAVLATLVFTVLVLFVGFGWYLLLKQPLGTGLAVAAGLAFSVGALALARLIGEGRARHLQRHAPSYRWWYGWPVYLLLLLISAFGTVNAFFVMFEGSAVVRQDMAEVRRAYDGLSVSAHRDLVLASHQSKAVTLDSLLTNLHGEIVNPNGGNFCGVGSAAEAILADIRAVVPTMPRIRGTGAIRPCVVDKAESVYAAYAASARATLGRDAAFIAFAGPRKTAFLQQLDTNVAAMRAAFGRMDGALSDPTAFTRADVQGPLATVAGAYAGDHGQFADLIRPRDTGLPAEVDITASQQLGSIPALFRILFRHLLSWRTIAYIALAVCLDLATVQIFRLIVFRYAEDEQSVVVDPYRQEGLLPRYIWRNPPAADFGRRLRHV